MKKTGWGLLIHSDRNTDNVSSRYSYLRVLQVLPLIWKEGWAGGLSLDYFCQTQLYIIHRIESK